MAFRDLIDDAGAPVAPSDGFLALRDNITTSSPALEQSRPRFNRIFGLLASMGWARSSLSLAWSFTTNSQTNTTARLLTARDDALARIAARGGVAWTVTSVENNTDPTGDWARRVIGQFESPCYLPNNALPSLDSRLVLDSRGLPVFVNYVNFTFEVRARQIIMTVQLEMVVRYQHPTLNVCCFAGCHSSVACEWFTSPRQAD